MKNQILLLALLIFCSAHTFSQKKTDLEIRGLKGQVKQIEDFSRDFEGDKENRIKEPRKLDGITDYNRAGNITEVISLFGDYKKFVYFYDSNDKRTFIDEYGSSKATPGRNLVVVSDESWSYSPEISQLKEILLTKVFFKSNGSNEEIEETIKFPEGNLVGKKVAAYDKAGKLIRYSIYKSNNTPVSETVISYKNNGRLIETIQIENGIIKSKSISYFDKEGKKIKDENFSFISEEGNLNKETFVLTNTQNIEYKDRKTIMESITFDTKGIPVRKVLFIDNENDDEISCESFEYLIPSDKNVKPEWRLTEREIREYEYDKNSNWIKSVWFKQEDENEPLLPNLIQERVISYF